MLFFVLSLFLGLSFSKYVLSKYYTTTTCTEPYYKIQALGNFPEEGSCYNEAGTWYRYKCNCSDPSKDLVRSSFTTETDCVNNQNAKVLPLTECNLCNNNNDIHSKFYCPNPNAVTEYNIYGISYYQDSTCSNKTQVRKYYWYYKIAQQKTASDTLWCIDVSDDGKSVELSDYGAFKECSSGTKDSKTTKTMKVGDCSQEVATLLFKCTGYYFKLLEIKKTVTVDGKVSNNSSYISVSVILFLFSLMLYY